MRHPLPPPWARRSPIWPKDGCRALVEAAVRDAGDVQTAVPDSVHRALALPGWPIPQPLREQAESFFGTDFAHIRLHADAIAATAAAESRAHAIVSGHHILLSRQRRDLALPAAQRTLAHELTHTLTLQPASVSTGTFESDTAPCETAAVAASRAFTPGAVASPSVAAP